LLEVKGAVVAYGRRVALEDVEITVRPGDAVALIGPNGAGKSTLLKAILGLLPLSDGTVSVFGGPPERARSRVAYVPQEDALDPEFPVSVLQVVLMGRYRTIGWGRRPSAADRAQALAALAEVRLADRAHQRFGTLSGGQRQRVLLARAVAQEAKLLLLDEPFNGLDATTTDILIEVLARLRSEGAGVVMSTHDLAVAHLTCDEACLLNRHQIAYGPIAETLTPERLAETYGSRALVLANGASVITTVRPAGTPYPGP
jgi:manganese/iron transport system ATP-binding protein